MHKNNGQMKRNPKSWNELRNKHNLEVLDNAKKALQFTGRIILWCHHHAGRIGNQIEHINVAL